MKYAAAAIVVALLFLLTSLTVFYMQRGYMPTNFNDYWNFLF